MADSSKGEGEEGWEMGVVAGDVWAKFQKYLLVPFVQGAALGVGGQLAYYMLRWWFGYSVDALPLAFPSTRAHDTHVDVISSSPPQSGGTRHQTI